ncbi:hypothetical protein HOS75_gp024 [Gordonia phage SteveFrench]|uniref:Uncharacterized protein n=2 Tax=Montyvirus stevefrench TaxID=2734258 RepID=A0A890UTZ2_9CAUD|nr:hypothetical protein HOS75_gp024 [Gordonia phage SteveFrench]AUV60706.1 hypothetical protein SEA_STEVEFRENCH_104 [Gordonia phage SteveFrench]QRI45690.1 hypothetical protein SEA_ROYALG_106 [Gordonia phage RoyalG]
MKHNITSRGYGIMHDVRVTERKSLTATRGTALSANLGNTGAQLNQMDVNRDNAANVDNWHVGGPIECTDPDTNWRDYYAEKELKELNDTQFRAPKLTTVPVRPNAPKSAQRSARELAEQKRARAAAKLARRRAR